MCFLYISPFLTQAMLMAGTVIGPGTIFLMLVGAFVAAFKISNWYSFYYNLMPILIYTLVCLTCRTSIQVKMPLKRTPIYIFDDHSQSMFFWHKAKFLKTET